MEFGESTNAIRVDLIQLNAITYNCATPVFMDVEKYYNLDIDKSIDMLDYKPTTNVDIGIEQLITWYKEFYKC